MGVEIPKKENKPTLREVLDRIDLTPLELRNKYKELRNLMDEVVKKTNKHLTDKEDTTAWKQRMKELKKERSILKEKITRNKIIVEYKVEQRKKNLIRWNELYKIDIALDKTYEETKLEMKIKKL